MFSHNELLDMVATDAVEEDIVRHIRSDRVVDEGYRLPLRTVGQRSSASPTLNYGLRLVAHPDGRHEWKD